MSEKLSVIWSLEAKKTFTYIVSFIIEKWSQKEALNFENKVSNLVQNLSSNKFLCPQSKIDNARRCTISKQSSLIYEIVENNIYILVLVDNRTNHKY